MESALALGAIYAAHLFVAAPTAERQPLPFDWSAPTECPSADDVRQRIEDHLGSSLAKFDQGAFAWSVAGTITRAPDGGWELALVIDTPDGRHERPLHDLSDCAVVSNTAALLIALALDPEAVATNQGTGVAGDSTGTAPVVPTPDSATAEPTQPTEPPPPLHADPDPAPPAQDAPSPPSRPSTPAVRAALSLSGGVDWGSLRGTTATGQASVAALFRRARVGAYAFLGSTREYQIPAIDGPLKVWMWAVGVEGGPVFRVRSFEFPLLAGLEAGQLAMWPRALLDPKRQRAGWAALVVSPAAAWAPLPWFAVVARAGPVITLTRPSFAVEGVGVLHRPAPVGIRASLALEARFQ